MALRAVPDHPKFMAFKSMLRLPKGAALGWLESIWHFAGRFAPHGNIGKYSDAQIESWVEWDGAPGALIAALVECGWIDKSTQYRLLVHDWAQHADKATKQAVHRSQSPFIGNAVHTPGAQRGHEAPDSVTPYPLPVPEPVPVPVPVPVNVSEAKASSPRQVGADPIEAIYRAYPRKVGKRVALKAIARAIQHVKARGMPMREAQEWLWKRVMAYARSPAGQDGEFTPHPGTWFNQGRYDDDPAEWQRKGEERSHERADGKARGAEADAEAVADLIGWGKAGQNAARN